MSVSDLNIDDDNGEKEGEFLETKEISVSKLSSTMVQALYKEVTDNTESIAKAFEPGKIVRRDDISNFCHRFRQTSLPYNPQGLKISFSIRRKEDQLETFTSLDRFLASDAAGGKITKNITVELSFLLKPRQSEKFREYKAILRIDSTEMPEKSESEDFIISVFNAPGFTFHIEYVEYSVALAFLAMAEDWHRSLEDAKTSKKLSFLKRKFNFFTDTAFYTNLSGMFGAFFALYSVYMLSIVWKFDNLPHSLISFSLVGIAIILIMRFIAISLISSIIKTVSAYRIPNFVLLNNKDDYNKSRFENAEDGIIKKGFLILFGYMAMIVINIFSSWIFAKLLL